MEEYIEKHSLTCKKSWPGTPKGLLETIPLIYVSPDDVGDYSRDDRFELHSNATETHILSHNITQNSFRIVKCDDRAKKYRWSKWRSCEADHKQTELDDL